MRYLKNIYHFINESKSDLLEEYEIKDFFYDYLDEPTFEENFQLDYYSNLYFLRKYLNNKLIEDLEYVMQYSDDWEEAVYGDILYKDLFIDITSDEFKDKQDNFFRKNEQIIVKPGPNFRDNKLSNLDKLILDNSEKGIIHYYFTMSLSFGRFSPQRYDILLECLSIFYESTGWRPFDGIWTEDYLDENNEIYEFYGASLKLFNGSDEEYKKLCEVSVFGKSPDHPQRKLLKTFL